MGSGTSNMQSIHQIQPANVIISGEIIRSSYNTVNVVLNTATAVPVLLSISHPEQLFWLKRNNQEKLINTVNGALNN